MAGAEAMILAEVKRRIRAAQEQLAEAQTAIAKWEGVLEALGQAKPKPGRPKAKTAGKPRNMTAAHDAMAVKRGTATPEQYERYAKRQQAKEAGKGTGTNQMKANGPVVQQRAKRAAAGTGTAPGASLQPDTEAESES